MSYLSYGKITFYQVRSLYRCFSVGPDCVFRVHPDSISIIIFIIIIIIIIIIIVVIIIIIILIIRPAMLVVAKVWSLLMFCKKYKICSS